MKTDTNMARITGLSKRTGSRFYQLCTVIPQDLQAAYDPKVGAALSELQAVATRTALTLSTLRQHVLFRKRRRIFYSRLLCILPEHQAPVWRIHFPRGGSCLRTTPGSYNLRPEGWQRQVTKENWSVVFSW